MRSDLVVTVGALLRAAAEAGYAPAINSLGVLAGKEDYRALREGSVPCTQKGQRMLF